MRILRSLVFLTTGMICSQLAFATGGRFPGDDAVIHGYIVDAVTKKPVSGVLVTASNNKKTVEKEVATNASGYFKLDELPAGGLEIRFDKKGYKRFKKEQVIVSEGSIQRLNVDLYLEKVATESPVVFEYPALRLIDGIF